MDDDARPPGTPFDVGRGADAAADAGAGPAAGGRGGAEGGGRVAVVVLCALSVLFLAVAVGMAVGIALALRDLRGAAEATATVVGAVDCDVVGEGVSCTADVRAGDDVRRVPVDEDAVVGSALPVLVDPSTGAIRNSGSRASTIGVLVALAAVGLVALACVPLMLWLARRQRRGGAQAAANAGRSSA